MKSNKEPAFDKIAMADPTTTYEVCLNEKFTLTRDEYMLYRISRQAFEEQRAQLGIKNMEFGEYALRGFIVAIGERIATGLSNMRTGHA